MRYVVAIALCLFATADTPADAAEAVIYERDVRPILAEHCLRCHGAKASKAELNLGSRDGVLAGGESGEVVIPGKTDQSLLYELVLAGDMPPEDDKRLSDEQVATIAKWIIGGARFATDREDLATQATTQHDVLPILYRRCVMCHGSGNKQAELDTRTRDGMLAEGASGPAIVPGDPDKSSMVARVRDRLCPPQEALGQAGIEPMTPDELTTFTRWIGSGAPDGTIQPDIASMDGDRLVSDPDREFWSFRPPTRQGLPEVARPQQIRTPIDTFLLAKLEEQGMTFSAEADRLTLLRRATFALTGLPPSPEQVTEFLADQRPNAYEALIDELLASPRFGEKVGRFWLDLAGYADSEGKRHADTVRPYAYRYRDYVIQAFNADRPYDEFLTEQIAGDELVDYANPDDISLDVLEKLIATGFLRMAPDGTSANPVNRFSDRVEVIADEIDVLGRGVMGLTLHCARCHSHKYDPIPQRDYYRFTAIFKGAYDEYDWLTPQPFTNQWKMSQQRHLNVGLPSEAAAIEAHNKPLREQIAMLTAERKEEKNKKRSKELAEEIKELQSQLQEVPKIRALWDRGRPSPTYIYRRGVETDPGRLVGPGVPSVLTDGKTAFVVDPPQHSSPKTGRRLALARWLTKADHPLTARVIVNRVWHQVFGRGIVQSIDNFGKLGTPPAHPELLDWLAVDFVQSGWSIKGLHRLMMTSTAYRQSSTVSANQELRDPDNRLVSRHPIRRLRAEEVRDSILFVAGRLSEQPFGKPDPVDIRKDGLVTSKAVRGGWRRSIYVRHRRKEMPSILETFDLPQMNPNCTQRIDSTVVSQPLHLLNNKMIYELSRSFADRIEWEAGASIEAKLGTAYLLALGRAATDDQLAAGQTALLQLAKQWRQHGSDDEDAQHRALADFCHALLNSASFLYVD